MFHSLGAQLHHTRPFVSYGTNGYPTHGVWLNTPPNHLVFCKSVTPKEPYDLTAQPPGLAANGSPGSCYFSLTPSHLNKVKTQLRNVVSVFYTIFTMQGSVMTAANSNVVCLTNLNVMCIQSLLLTLTGHPHPQGRIICVR